MNDTTNEFGVEVELTGQDGNAFAVMGACRRAARKAGIPNHRIEEFTNEAMVGDYDHLLRTCMRYFDVS